MSERKPLRYTIHAEDAVVERELDPVWIEAAAREPEWSRPDPRRPGVERRFRSIPEYGGRVLSRGLLGNGGRKPYHNRGFRPGRAKAAMRPTIKYRAEDNAAYIRLSGEKVLDSSEVTPDVVF